MKINFKKTSIVFVGIIAILFGSLWFLQGTSIIQICPILCFADCECLTGGSPLWTVVGLIALSTGIGAVYFGLKHRRRSNIN